MHKLVHDAFGAALLLLIRAACPLFVTGGLLLANQDIDHADGGKVLGDIFTSLI